VFGTASVSTCVTCSAFVSEVIGANNDSVELEPMVAAKPASATTSKRDFMTCPPSLRALPNGALPEKCGW
jgi:hypothetical protein